ncbi:unnamed protein product, partial [Prunus brigantina]
NHIISSYARKSNATYGACQHAGKSYATCDQTIISHNLPHTPENLTPRMGSVDMPENP